MINTPHKTIERSILRSRGREIHNNKLDSALIINLCSCRKDMLLLGSTSICITAVSSVAEYANAGLAVLELVGEEGVDASDGNYYSRLVCIQFSGLWLRYDQLPPSVILWLIEHKYKNACSRIWP